VQTHVPMQCANQGDTCLTAPAAFPPGTPRRPSRPPSFLAPGLRPQWVQAYPGCGCHPLAGRNHGGHDEGMSFFDGVPSAEPVPPWSQRPWDPPEAGFPGVVPFSTLVLARTERAAVAINGLSAYAAGFEIYVTARFRPGTDTGPGGPVPGGPGPGGPLRSFRFGLQLADGTKVIGQRGGGGPDGDAEPDGPILRMFLGGASPRSSLSRWWAWPLPPAGPLEFVCEWPTLGIPESRAGLDAQLILDAAGQSIRLWPDDEG